MEKSQSSLEFYQDSQALREGLKQVSEAGYSVIKNYGELIVSGDILLSQLTLALGRARFSLTNLTNPGKVAETFTTVRPDDMGLDLQLAVSAFAEILRLRIQDNSDDYSRANDPQPLYPILQSWRPNEVSVQRYEKDQLISAHRDHIKYLGLVAILNVQGQAELGLHLKRDWPPYDKAELAPGDLVLLRATALNPAVDNQGHPGVFHSVKGVSDEPRISVTFRYLHEEV